MSLTWERSLPCGGAWAKGAAPHPRPTDIPLARAMGTTALSDHTDWTSFGKEGVQGGVRIFPPGRVWWGSESGVCSVSVMPQKACWRHVSVAVVQFIDPVLSGLIMIGRVISVVISLCPDIWLSVACFRYICPSGLLNILNRCFL